MEAGLKSLGNAGDARAIEGRLETLGSSDVARWGKMTAPEVVCHLRESFHMASGQRSAAPIPGPLPGPVIKFLALRVPKRWPKGVPTVPELQVGGERMKVGEFAADKSGLMVAYGEFLRRQGNRSAHPIFGRMSPGDWMRWGYLHTDHHLRQFGR